MTRSYSFTETPQIDGSIRLEWSADGKYHPLNFWVVPTDIPIENAKARVRSGEFDSLAEETTHG
jgi:hypothetical protein